MASKALITPTPAQQPGLRPYIVYDRLPAGCVLHYVVERTCPILHQGEAVAVDPNDRTIEAGDLFVMESRRSHPDGPIRNVVEFKQRSFCLRGSDGEFRHTPCWTALFYSETKDFDGSNFRSVRMTDGPAPVADPAYFAERIVGRVVGIVAAAFAEPARLTT